MVVGGGDAGRRAARRRLHLPRARPGAGQRDRPLEGPRQRSREAVALALALCAVLLGFALPAFFDLLQIGRAAAIGGL
jgi:hypothetical protein